MSDVNAFGAETADDSSPDGMQEEQVMPTIEDLVARLNQQEGRLSEIDRMKHDVSSGLGRVQNFQSQLDKFVAANADTGDVSARQDQVEATLELLSEALSELLPEDVQTQLRNKQLESRLEALEGSSNPQVEEAIAEPTADVNNLIDEAKWQEAATETHRLVKQMGYNPLPPDQGGDVPVNVYEAGVAASQGNPYTAINYVVDWVKNNLQEDAAASRIAETKAAAGQGAPPRAGSSPNIDDLVSRVATSSKGLSDLSEADKAKVLEHMGPALRQLRR